MNSNSRPLYNAKQSAEVIGTTVPHIRHAVKDGRLKAFRVGRELRIFAEDLYAFVRQTPARTRDGKATSSTAGAKNLEAFVAQTKPRTDHDDASQ